jgi:replicative DNA helicase
MCSVGRVDSQRVRSGYLNPGERQKLNVALAEIADSKLYIDDKSAATAAGMHAKVRRQLAKGPVDLVITDYLQLMSAGRTFENRTQEVTSITRGLKLMTSEIGAPVIALSQLSRAVEQRKGDHRPQLSDLRESGSIEQDADNVAFIFRPEMYDRDREDLRGVAELIIGKQRSGPIGIIKLVFLHNLTRFENRAEDTGVLDEPLPFGSESYDTT